MKWRILLHLSHLDTFSIVAAIKIQKSVFKVAPRAPRVTLDTTGKNWNVQNFLFLVKNFKKNNDNWQTL